MSTTAASTSSTTTPPTTTTISPHNRDNMSIGSAESLAPRWVSPDPPATTSATGANGANKHHTPVANIHWVGVLRDDTMLAEYCNEPDNPKILQMSRRFLKTTTTPGSSKGKGGKPSSPASPTGGARKVDWEFKTYAVQSQRRMVHAVKFLIYDKVPLEPGARAKLINLQAQSFLNGETVRIIEYQQSTNKYLIRPSIPLPEAQKLATTGMLVVHAKHLVAPEQLLRIWTIAVLYDGKRLTQNMACQFLEKLLVISETFRNTEEWLNGSEMSCQSSFAPILASQMEQFIVDPSAASIDESLEYTKELIQRNKEIVQQQNPSGYNPSSSASVSTNSSSVNNNHV